MNPTEKAVRRRIYLMRHGAVTYFTPAGVPIPPDGVPLNTAGITQAEAAGRLFAQHGVNFDRVIVSGLPRTIQTAERLLAQLESASTLEHRPALQEIRAGKLRDIPKHELRESFLSVLYGTASLDTKFMGGESVGELLDRVLPEIDGLRQDPDWSTLLLVLHGGVNRAILSYLLSGQRTMMGGFEQSPACINVIDIGAAPRDVILRATNLSPTDWLQHDTRSSTMEVLFGQYSAQGSRNP
ncbi:MAG: histidine phosphatase family protein [Burkholderiales bacterium]